MAHECPMCGELCKCVNDEEGCLHWIVCALPFDMNDDFDTLMPNDEQEDEDA